MSLNQKTESVYKAIMEKLINEIKDEALTEGCSEDLVKELKLVRILKIIVYIIKQIWEHKMIEAGVFQPKQVFN